MTTQFVLLTLPDGAELHGSSRSEIVDQFIPGHGSVPESEGAVVTRLLMRENVLAGLAERAQATVMAALTEQHPSLLDQLGEDGLTVVFHERGREVVELAEWASDIPLFLLASGYQPYTDVPRPAGEAIVFLDSLNETTFLDSVQAAGFAELYERPVDDL